MLPGLQEIKECKETKCFMHLTSGKGYLSREGVVYRGDCVICEDVGPSCFPDPHREGEVVMVSQEDRKPGPRSSDWGNTGWSLLGKVAQHLESLKMPEQHTVNEFVKQFVEYHNDQEIKG